MDFYQRIIDYFDKPVSIVETTLGLSNGYINKCRAGKIQEPTKLTNALRRKGLNVDYFLTGNGKPERAPEPPVAEAIPPDSIPYYDIDVMAHIAEALDLKDEKPAGVLSIPGFSNCVACFPVFGDSMEPKISNGDIIAVSTATPLDCILWGEIYLVITDAWRVVKTVHPGITEEYIVLRSINPDYKGDTPVKKDNVRALYLVRGVVSRMGM